MLRDVGVLRCDVLELLGLFDLTSKVEEILNGQDPAVFQVSFYESQAEVLFSPVAATLPPRELADWILADRVNVRFQLQLHKILWGDEPGR